MINEELLSVCLYHLNHYPLMRLQDLVKLIYQHEFGANHLIKDDETMIREIELEFSQHSKEKNIELFDQVSTQLFRINLNHPRVKPFHLSTIAKAFRKSLATSNDFQLFKEKLKIVYDITSRYDCMWDQHEAKRFLDDYESNQFPPLSHSNQYKEAYHPSYRLVSKDFKDYFDVFARIDAKMQEKTPCYVAIDGMCGSGKTRLATFLSTYYDCNVIRMDDFFLQPHQRSVKRLSEVGGNIDYVRFNEEVIKGLLSNEPFTVALYDCQTTTFNQTIEVINKPLTIIEGSYSMHPLYIDFYDILIFLKVDKSIQLERIKRRNPELYERFMNEWIPMEDQYHATFQLEARSDITIHSHHK